MTRTPDTGTAGDGPQAADDAALDRLLREAVRADPFDAGAADEAFTQGVLRSLPTPAAKPRPAPWRNLATLLPFSLGLAGLAVTVRVLPPLDLPGTLNQLLEGVPAAASGAPGLLAVIAMLGLWLAWSLALLRA